MSVATIFAGALISILLVLGALFIWALILSGFDVDRAVERSTRSLSGLVLGISTVGIMIGGEIIGGIVSLITTAPSGLINGLLGLLGYLSISGVVSLQAETWGLIVIVLMAAGLILRDRTGA